ncbi:Defensin-like protein [Medicago truncatula]|uniref:Defensin-like protein n=1 Tax=Medicago truncatula TaxID=3880 RepID=A0A072V8S9_MEDTR|nr:Defensin-like protein [Medicago truncatula]
MRNQKIIFLALISLLLMFLGVNGKATGEKCKIQQPCGMKNCNAQCQGLCDASGGYSAYCDPPNGVCKCVGWRTRVFNSLS